MESSVCCWEVRTWISVIAWLHIVSHASSIEPKLSPLILQFMNCGDFGVLIIISSGFRLLLQLA